MFNPLTVLRFTLQILADELIYMNCYLSFFSMIDRTVFQQSIICAANARIELRLNSIFHRKIARK